jgi:hypothetical protein
MIVGLDHELQTPDQRVFSTGDLPAAETHDKTRYRRLLETLLKRGARQVAEEWLPPPHTIAHGIAALHAVRHAYVDMPLQQRHAHGIPAGTLTILISAAQRAAWHSERESFMVEGLLSASGDLVRPS